MILKTQAPEFDNSFLIVRAFVKFLNLRTNHATWTDGSRPWSGSKRSKKNEQFQIHGISWFVFCSVIGLFFWNPGQTSNMQKQPREFNRTNKSLLPTIKQCRVKWSEPHFVLFLSGGASRHVAKAEHPSPWHRVKAAPWTILEVINPVLEQNVFVKSQLPNIKTRSKVQRTKPKPNRPNQPQPTGQKIQTAWAGCKKHEARTQ